MIPERVPSSHRSPQPTFARREQVDPPSTWRIVMVTSWRSRRAFREKRALGARACLTASRGPSALRAALTTLRTGGIRRQALRRPAKPTFAD